MSPLSQLQVNLVPSTRSTNSFRLDADGIYVPGFQESTSIPSAISGDMWRYESTTNPAVQWAFVFSEAAGAWVWLGGSPLYDEVQPSGTRAGSGTPAYGDLTAAGGGGTGPAVTVPFAGVYVIEFGAMVNAGVGGSPAFMSPSIGGVAAVDADSLRSATTFSVSLMRRVTKTVGTAGAVIQMKYKNTGTGADPDASYSQRWLSVRPLSVS
jgi:hypothetical protein